MKILLLAGSVFIFISCGSRNGEVKEYYDTIKAELHTKQNNIDAILSEIKDNDEKSFEEMQDTTKIQDEVKFAIRHPKDVKCKLPPIYKPDYFLVNAEMKKKVRYKYFAATDSRATDLFTDDMYYIIKKDSLKYELFLDIFKNKVADFTKRKYLIVLDCIYYKNTVQPDLYSTDFVKGHVVKRVDIYSIENRKLLDSYYLFASSSGFIQHDKESFADFNEDLGNNLVKELDRSLCY